MIKRKNLSCGATLITEKLPYIQSASVGIFVKSGASHEPEELCGMSHFIEHMLFKGTKTRSASDLANAFEIIGGQSNAYTSKGTTVFYAKTLDSHLAQGIELLGDMICSPAFVKNDVELERGVILEEINMYQDSPEDLVADKLFEKVWAGNALGREILGTPETLKTFTSEKIAQYHGENYTAENIVISIAGNFDEEAISQACEKAFFGLPRGKSREPLPEADFYRARIQTSKEIEQNHICFGFNGLKTDDEQRYTMALANNILGNGMSSRLFMKLREKLGLVYSIYSFLMPHENGGMAGVYSAHSKENEKKTAEAITEELALFVSEGVTENELTRAKESMKTNIVMGLESSYSRMAHNAKGMMNFGRILSAEQMIDLVDNASIEKIAKLSKRIFSNESFSISALGKPLSKSFYEELKI